MSNLGQSRRRAHGDKLSLLIAPRDRLSHNATHYSRSTIGHTTMPAADSCFNTDHPER